MYSFSLFYILAEFSNKLNQNQEINARYKLVTLIKNNLYSKSSLTNTYKGQQSHKVKSIKESHIFFEIFKNIRKIK